MNFCWNRYHLIGAYGAFGSVTKKRYEINVEGLWEGEWKEICFKAKPVKLDCIPPQYAPYHLRLDWLMWFLPFSVRVTESEIFVWGHERWFLELLLRIFESDKQTLGLLKGVNMPEGSPEKLRALFYHYEFTSRLEYLNDRRTWKRRYLGEYLGPISRDKLKAVLMKT